MPLAATMAPTLDAEPAGDHGQGLAGGDGVGAWRRRRRRRAPPAGTVRRWPMRTRLRSVMPLASARARVVVP